MVKAKINKKSNPWLHKLISQYLSSATNVASANLFLKERIYLTGSPGGDYFSILEELVKIAAL
jgi:hypothetical protein